MWTVVCSFVVCSGGHLNEHSTKLSIDHHDANGFRILAARGVLDELIEAPTD